MTHHNLELLVGTNYTAAQAASAVVVGTGEIIPVGMDNVLLAGGTLPSAAPSFRLVQGTVDGPRMTHEIRAKEVVGWSGKSYAARVEQRSFIGYNGVATNTISASNDSTYVLRILFTFDDTIWAQHQDLYTFYYTTDSSATASEIATEFARQINDLTGYVAKWVTATVTNSGADYGIRIDAKSMAQYFSAEIEDYDMVTFKLVLGTSDSTVNTSPWGTTPVDEYGVTTGTGATQSLVPSRGHGEWQEMARIEFRAASLRGQTNYVSHPVISTPRYVVSGATYDIYTLVFDYTEASGELDQRNTSRHLCYIILPAGANTLRGRFEAFMNPYMNALGFASVTL